MRLSRRTSVAFAGAPGSRPISMIADARAVRTAHNGIVREDPERPSLRGRARGGTGLEVEFLAQGPEE